MANKMSVTKAPVPEPTKAGVRDNTSVLVSRATLRKWHQAIAQLDVEVSSIALDDVAKVGAALKKLLR